MTSDSLTINARTIAGALMSESKLEVNSAVPGASFLLERQADEIDRLRARVAELEAQRSDLMRVLEAILIEVEPLRYEQRQNIEKACHDQAEWAKRANAARMPGSEPWAFMAEFREQLESALEPLNKAVQDGNAVYDRIAGLDTPATEGR